VIGVAALDGRFLAVGVGWQEDDKGVTVNVPLFWLSADGREWTLAADASWPGGDIDVVGTWRGEFLAAGHVGEERASAAFWTSADGRQWQRLPDRPVLEFFSGATVGRDIVGGGIAAIRVEGDELIATGWLYCACERELREGAVEWRTTDGEHWQRSDGPAPEGWQQPVAGGPGWLRISVDGAAIESSSDGISWQPAWTAPVSADGDAPSVQLFALGPRPAGFLAVGAIVASGRSSPLAISSDDGLAWTRSAGWPAIDELEGTMLGFAAAPGGVVAVGPVGDPAQPYAWLHEPVIAGE
jgi:hypothetical protein